MITDPAVNTVYIVTPTAYHYEIYKVAMAAGKDIFCEKPLTDTLAKIDEMIALRDRSNQIVQVGLVLRHEPLFWYIKQLMEHESAGWGKLINIIFRDDQTKPYTGSGTHPSKWRRDPSVAYHGTLFEHSIHDIDQIHWWFGATRNIYAQVRFFAGLEPIEDSVSATIEMENGASLSLSSIWHNVEHDTRYIEIFFENAYIRLDYDNSIGKIYISELDKRRRRIKARDTEKYYMEAHGLKDFPKHWLRGYGYENIAFIRSLISRNPASPSLEDASGAHSVVEACYRSSKEKRIIALKELFP
ncbi:MAG: Gfo/Idh/MocA family protein [Promethearchaeota archaeon]